jgi:hypothetical protein
MHRGGVFVRVSLKLGEIGTRGIVPLWRRAGGEPRAKHLSKILKARVTKDLHKLRTNRAETGTKVWRKGRAPWRLLPGGLAEEKAARPLQIIPDWLIGVTLGSELCALLCLSIL